MIGDGKTQSSIPDNASAPMSGDQSISIFRHAMWLWLVVVTFLSATLWWAASRREIAKNPGPRWGYGHTSHCGVFELLFIPLSVPRAAGFALLLLSAIAVHAGESNRDGDKRDQIDTENLFGFTKGTDTGEVGERELQGETEGQLGKRAGLYSAAFQTFEAEFVPRENLRVSIGPAFSLYQISDVPGLNDQNELAFQGMSFDMRYRLLDREHARLGIAIEVEPHWGLKDETTGEAADQYGVDLTVAIDKELIPNRVVAAFNLLYQSETTRLRTTGIWEQESTIGAAAALMFQVRAGTLLGAEARYLRKYDGTGLDNLSGHGLFLGPTIFFKTSESSFVSASWSSQIAGRSTDDPGWLDLTNFQRHQAKVRFGINF